MNPEWDVDEEAALESALDNLVKGADPTQFKPYGTAKPSKSGAAINFIPSKESKAKGAKAFTVSKAMLLKLINGEVQYIGLSSMSDKPQSSSSSDGAGE